MKHRPLLFVLAALVVLGPIVFVPHASAQQVHAYGTTAPSSISDSELYEINMADGTPTPIGTITGYGRVLAIDVEPVSQTIYGTGVRLSDMTAVLLTIDRETGAGTEVGPIGMPLTFTGLSFQPNSTQLYAVGGTSGGDLSLYTIDIVTGMASLVGDTGLEPDSARGNALSWGGTPISDLLVQHTGGVPPNNPDLYTLHLGTGAATFSVDLTFPGGTSADAAFHSLDVNPLSEVYFGPYVQGSGAGSETRLGRLDSATGQVTDVGLINAGLPIMEGFTLLIDNSPQVTVLSPNGDESFQPNTPVTITWDATDDIAVEHVSIGYFTGLKIYGSSTAGTSSPSSFYEIDLGDGSATLIGPIGFDRVGAMDQHPGTGVIYAVGEIPATTTYVLLTIDPETGVGTQVGPTNLPVGGGISDISFNPFGETLNGYRQVNSGDGSELYTFDLTTGEATLVERTGRMNAGGNALAFGPGGLHFQSTMGSVPGAEFFEMNPFNANLTLLSSASFPPPYDVAVNQPRLAAMDYQPLSGNLFCIIKDDVSPRAFGTANPGTGSVLVRGSTDPGMDGLVYAIDPCVTIAASEPNDGVFEWVTPDTNLASVRIKITAYDASGNSRTDFSNTYFSVDGQPPTVHVIYPNNGENLTPGNIEDILWTATDNVGVDHVDIAYATGLTLFGSTTAGTVQPSDFYEIDFTNGAASLIGAINFERVGAMDQHPGTGVIYAIGELIADNKKSLLTIDPASGAGSQIGLTGMPVGGGVSDISFDPRNNHLYAYHATSPSGSGLYRIDLATGAATLIGNNGRIGTAGNAMGFSPGAGFYLQSTDGSAPGAQFFSLDETTSAVTFLSNTIFPPPYDIAVNRPRMSAIDFQPLSSTPFCIINDDVAPYALGTFDPFSGNVLVRGTTTSGMDGLVYAFHPSFDIASGEANDGTYSWLVPNTPSTSCRVRITAYDAAGNSRTNYETINFTIVDLVSAPPAGNFVTFLGANAPNPFRDQTTIHFGLAKQGSINLSLYDARGRLIRTLFDGEHEAGTHALTWDGASNGGSQVGSGHYLLRYRGEGFMETRSISLIR